MGTAARLRYVIEYDCGGFGLSDSRIEAAGWYVHAFRSAEGSAGRLLDKFLAEDVVVEAGKEQITGREAVLARLVAQRPGFTAHQMGAFGEPIPDGGDVIVEASFPAFGTGASSMTFRFSFNQSDQICRVVESSVTRPALQGGSSIPLPVRGLIDNALINGTPLVLSYVNELGEPQMSLRGSTRVYGPRQLSIWLRTSGGGLLTAIAQNPHVALLYRDSKTRSTLTIKGIAHIDATESVRERVYGLAPEVEQLHDPHQGGAALLIDVTDLRGGTPEGAVRLG
jgi:hypothetical protein